MPHQLWVFGSNGEGQIGIPAADIVSIPTQVKNPPPLESLKSIRCGDNHTLLLARNATLYGVGDNRKSQLAARPRNGTRLGHFKSLETVRSLIAATCESSAGLLVESARADIVCSSGISSTCVTAEQGEIITWVFSQGTGQWGELGRGEHTITTDEGLTSVSALTVLRGTAIDFAAGVWHYVAIFEDGSVYGWGKARLGQLGDGFSTKVTVPTKIEAMPFMPRKVVCGKDFTYLVGDPSSGEHIILGKDKFNIISDMPNHVKGWKNIGATWHAIFVLFNDGSLTAWGKENMWKLLPPGLPMIEKIAVGSDHILALTKDGKLISWGWGKHGNCGDLSKIRNDMKNDMVSGFWNEIDIPGQIKMISAGFCTSFVITNTGGSSSESHLGSPTATVAI